MRVRRTTADSDSQYVYDEATWSVSRAVLNQVAFNTPVPICVSELRIKSNDQITGYVDDFNALCSSKLPTWDGANWDTVAETANPAALMRYLLTTRHGLSGPYTTSKLDNTALVALFEWCVAQGLEFNFIADSEKSTWERLTQVLSAARASVTTDVDGLWGAAIDQPGKTPKQLFTPRNSWGFKVSRGFMELPHALRVSFVDEEDDYDQKEFFVYADGYDKSTATNIVSWDYPGVTNWDDIWKMARRHLAKLLHRQFSISVNTDWEWLAIHRGNMVGVASDVLMNEFGTARILRLLFEVDGEEVLVGRAADIPLDELDNPLVPIGVQLDDTVIFSDPAPARYGIAIRDRSSALTTYEIVAEYGEERDVLRFSYALAAAQAPSLGSLCSVSILGEEYDEYLVSAITPVENLAAELVLIPYAMDEIEASVSGEIPAFNGQSRLDVTRGTIVPTPTVTTVRSDEGVLVRGADGTLSSRIMVNYSMSTGAVLADTVQAQCRRVGEPHWTSAPSVIAGNPVIFTEVEDGVFYDLRIRAMSSITGAASSWVTKLGHKVVGKSSPPPNLDSLYRQGSKIYWTYENAPIDFDGFLVRFSSGDNRNWEKGTDYPSRGHITTERSMDISGLDSSVVTIMVRPVDTSGNLSSSPSYLVLNLGEHSPDNLIMTEDVHGAGFGDTVLNGAVDESGNLVAHDAGTAYLPDDDALYLPQPVSDYLPLSYQAMTYEFSRVPAMEDAPGTMFLSTSISGEGWLIEYRRRGGQEKYLDQDDTAYLADDDAAYLGGSSPWASMPGGGIEVGREMVDFKISIDGGSRQGTISGLSVNIDVPDITESFDDIVIVSTGTRLPISKTYRTIDYIGGITLQDDGYGATGVRIKDKDPELGPMLEAVGASQATIDIYNMKGH
jgi:hypothetical protein